MHRDKVFRPTLLNLKSLGDVNRGHADLNGNGISMCRRTRFSGSGLFFSSVVADLAPRLGPDSERSGKKLYKIYKTLWLYKRGKSWLSQNKEKKYGNNDDPQISRPDLRFARRKTAKQHKTGSEPHQTKPHKSMGIASRHDRVKSTVSPKCAQTN